MVRKLSNEAASDDRTLLCANGKALLLPFFHNAYHVTQFLAQCFYQISRFLLSGFQCFNFSLLVIGKHVFVLQFTDAHGVDAFRIYVLDYLIYLIEVSQCDVEFLGH